MTMQLSDERSVSDRAIAAVLPAVSVARNVTVTTWSGPEAYAPLNRNV
jgi:hypothetical protein